MDKHILAVFVFTVALASCAVRTEPTADIKKEMETLEGDNGYFWGTIVVTDKAMNWPAEHTKCHLAMDRIGLWESNITHDVTYAYFIPATGYLLGIYALPVGAGDYKFLNLECYNSKAVKSYTTGRFILDLSEQVVHVAAGESVYLGRMHLTFSDMPGTEQDILLKMAGVDVYHPAKREKVMDFTIFMSDMLERDRKHLQQIYSNPDLGRLKKSILYKNIAGVQGVRVGDESDWKQVDF